ncbi:hypothetical protein Tco_0317942 [Tanacetum coccineum]
MERKIYPYLRVQESDKEQQMKTKFKSNQKKACMVSFQQLHSHLKRLLNNDLKGSRTENGFGRAFATLFGQDFEIFTGTMFLNMDQLQRILITTNFMCWIPASFKVLETQFQMFINSQIYLNDEYISIDERALHKMGMTEGVNESNGTESQEQDTCSRSGNDAHVDDADIRPIDNEEPMVEVQTTADDNVSGTGQQHTEQPESNNEGEVDQNADQCYDTCPLPAKLNDESDIVKTVSQSTKVDSLPHIHAHSTKTNYHESSRFKDKDFYKLLFEAFKMRHSMRMLGKDTRSQDGIDDKDNVKGSKSRSQSMKEQTYNKEQRERPRPHELNDKSNLIDLMKEWMTRSSNTRVFTPFANPKRQFRAKKDTTPIVVHNIYSFYESDSLEAESDKMVKIDIEMLTMEQYLVLDRSEIIRGVRRPEI